MDFQQLEQIMEIDDSESISQAARHFSISQSALSRSMKRLETELGCELFDRTPNGVTLNRTGMIVCEFAKKACHDLELLKENINATVNQNTAKIGSVAPAPMLVLTSRIIAHHHDIVIAPSIMEDDAIKRALLNRDIDYGITLDPLELPNMESRHLMSERIFAHMPKDTRYAAMTSLSFDDIDGEAFVVPNGTGHWLNLLKRSLPHSKIVVQPDIPVFQQMVHTSNALMFITDSPYSAAVDMHADNRVIIPIDDPRTTVDYYLTMRSDID